MRSTALRTASAPALSVLARRFSTYSPEKSGFTSAAKTWLRQRKGTWHYQTKLTVGGSLGFFNKLLGPTGREESTEGDRREVSLSPKCPVIMSQASLVKQISENVPSVPGSVRIEAAVGAVLITAGCLLWKFRRT